MKLFGRQIPFTARAEERASPNVVDDRWFSPNPFVYLGDGNEAVTPESALKFSAVYGCVKVISETLASVPLLVYERRADGGKDRAQKHPLYKLLRTRPNKLKTSGLEFREMLTAHVLLWGNGYAQIIKNRMGEPLELYPMHPSRVTPEMTAAGELVYRVQGRGGPDTLLPADEVFHLRGYRDQGLAGLSPIAAFRQAVTLGLSLESFGSNFFEGGAFPSGVLEFEGSLSDEAKKNLRNSWQELYGGKQRGKKVAVLEAGLKWKPMGIPQSDAQFLESRRFQVEEIARIYRVPPHMLGDLTRSTFSNIEQQSIDFITYTMLPWFRRWEEAITRDFLDGDDSEYFTEFLVDGLLRGDTLSRSQAYAVGRQWGWYSINDIRQRENLNPIGPEGDVYLSPLNMVPAGSEQEPPEPKEPPEEPEEDDGAEEDDAEDPKTPPKRSSEHRNRAFSPLFRGIFGKIARREANEPARYLKKTGEIDLENWLPTFVEEHRRFAQECLRDAVSAYSGAENDPSFPQSVENHVENYLSEAVLRVREASDRRTAEGQPTPDEIGDYWTGRILRYTDKEAYEPAA